MYRKKYMKTFKNAKPIFKEIIRAKDEMDIFGERELRKREKL